MTEKIYDWSATDESKQSAKIQDILLEIKQKERNIDFWIGKKNVALYHVKQNKAKIQLLELKLKNLSEK